MELFDQMGVIDEVRARGFHFEAMNIVVTGQPVRRVPAQTDELPYGYFGLAQPDTERILEQYWSGFGHQILRGQTVTGLEQDDGGVVALTDSGEKVRARYLVGCDGAHSTIRKLLKTPFQGQRFPMTFLLGDVRIDWDKPPRENWQFIHLEEGELRNVVTVIANPTGPKRYRVSAAVEDGIDCSDHPPLEILKEVFGPALPEGTELSDLRWSSRYNISHRIAGFYRSGRVFLAGDAAHIHPPIGGLGMNTGLQDAHNLSWKLAGAIQGYLNESVLDTYQAERLPVGTKVVEVTASRMEQATGGKSEVTEPPHFDSQLFIRYKPNLLVADQESPTGERLPTISGLKRLHVTGEVRLAELFRAGRFHLFVDSALESWQAVGKESLGRRLSCCCITPDRERAQMPNSLWDSEGGWERVFKGQAVLVRPDGVIGWIGSDPKALEAWLAAIV
jgi:2-polyprenyl-6-methoxyphenol hydroxylase-like FAD-dependent oxidoreductase